MASQSAYGGRKDYRAFVRAWLQERDPVSTLVSVRGMSGIGKSTWLSEMAAVAEESGAAVIWTAARNPNRPLLDTRPTNMSNQRLVICIDDADQLSDEDPWWSPDDGTAVLCLCTSRRSQSGRAFPFLRRNWHTHEWVLGPLTVTEVQDWLGKLSQSDTPNARKFSAVSSGHPGRLQRIFHSLVDGERTPHMQVMSLDPTDPAFNLSPVANPAGLAALAFLQSANFDGLAEVCGQSFTIGDYWDMARHEWIQVQGAGLSLLPPADVLLRQLVQSHMPTQASEWGRRAIALLLRDLFTLSQQDCHRRVAHLLRLVTEHRDWAGGSGAAADADEKHLLTPWAGIHMETLTNPGQAENLLEMIRSPRELHRNSLLTTDECHAFYTSSQSDPQENTQSELDIVRAESGEVMAWRLWLHLTPHPELHDTAGERFARLPMRLHTAIGWLIEEICNRQTSGGDEPEVWILLGSLEHSRPLACTEADLNLLLTAHALGRLVQPDTWLITGAGTPVLDAWTESQVVSLGLPVPVCVATSRQNTGEEEGGLRAWQWPMPQTRIQADTDKQDKSGSQPVRRLGDLAEDDVRQILRRLNHIPWLNDFVDVRALPMDGAELRDRVLGLLIADVPPEPLCKDDQRVLRVTYLERPGTAVAISARLAMSRSTYYRQLAEAHERLTAALSVVDGTGHDTDG